MRFIALIVLGGAVAAALQAPLFSGEPDAVIAVPALDNAKAAGPVQKAVLAGGCFWGVQGVFEHVHGVERAVAGYAGGEHATAQYETVSTGATGHAESVEITFDPAVISYGQILQIAFSVVHDPTQLNRQGPDVGSQYRSAVFYADESQKRIAEAYIKQLDDSGAYARPIVTQVAALRGFYPAEDYHQDFLVRHPHQPYIAMFDLPKIKSLKRMFSSVYREQPVTTGPE